MITVDPKLGLRHNFMVMKLRVLDKKITPKLCII